MPAYEVYTSFWNQVDVITTVNTSHLSALPSHLAVILINMEAVL